MGPGAQRRVHLRGRSCSEAESAAVPHASADQSGEVPEDEWQPPVRWEGGGHGGIGVGVCSGGAEGTDVLFCPELGVFRDMAAPRPRGSSYSGSIPRAPPPPPLRTNRTRRVPHPVLIGHAASFTPY